MLLRSKKNKGLESALPAALGQSASGPTEGMPLLYPAASELQHCAQDVVVHFEEHASF